MPVYYNLSSYQNMDNIIQVYAITDTLMLGYFSLFLVMVFGIFIAMIRIQRGDSTLNAIITSSFFSMMLSIVLYISNVYYSGITKIGLYVFIPAIILVGTSIVKYYNNNA